MKKKLLVFAVLVVMILSAVAIPGASAQDTYVIGISNGFVGSEWRTQMIEDIETVAAEIEEEMGVEIELVIESADVDVQGQIQQIENLINRGVDAIIVNPNDQSALSLTLEDAVAEGIVVIAVDQEIDAQGVYNVVINQKQWAQISAVWLAEQLGGEGDIVLIEGFVGHPANEARMSGVEEVLEMYPDIAVVGRDSGMWDQATGQQVMSDFLASIPELDGVWTQDGMADGVLNAITTAAPDTFPVVSGEARASYMKQWQAAREAGSDFQTIGVVNPPGIGGSGLRVAMEILMGGEVDESLLEGEFGNTLYVPIPFAVVDESFAEVEEAAMAMYEELGIELADDFFRSFEDVYAELNIDERNDSYTLDGIITQEQAQAFLVME